MTLQTRYLDGTEPSLPIRPLPIEIEGDEGRVIARPFILGSQRVATLFQRVQRLSDEEVATLLAQVVRSYADRHPDLFELLDEHYRDGASMIGFANHWDLNRQRLAGAYLTMEYAIESAALFNPSIVPHPDQSNLPPGAVRILLSLRATGEGHVSSIVFRTGTISASGEVSLDPFPRKLHRSRISPDRRYLRHLFWRKLGEMSIRGKVVDAVLSAVPEKFTLSELMAAVTAARASFESSPEAPELLRTILWLASSNYHIDLDPDAQLSELVIFPMSEEESRGIEDLRLVRFVDDDGSVTWYGTYTAYNGLRTLPMLMHTTDFRRIEFASLNGNAAQNKGMALFPRKINGRYVMCSRIDGENLYISTSHSVHFWETAQRLAAPLHPWELMQIGNCGSPIETEHGWLLLTHGVGPMRTYAIGAMLLDLADPLKIVGQLDQPLLAPVEHRREGYVPNVVYTCGAMVHRDTLYIPYAHADKATTMAAIPLKPLLQKLMEKK
ncbi:MAG: glycoside hydrolase family 130 protein [Phycisphaerae bacterium]|nr:glycoside hydrolase family 130 protein [Phycisphaerae bacterium]MDW8263062.1 glycoside hydrolase family 130 protein [Phycisphaerales bacterium]